MWSVFSAVSVPNSFTVRCYLHSKERVDVYCKTGLNPICAEGTLPTIVEECEKCEVDVIIRRGDILTIAWQIVHAGIEYGNVQ